MKTKAFLTIMMIVLAGSFCFSQPEQEGMKPATPKERLKMINERICKPLNLDNSQTEKVTSAFKDFFEEMDKLVDKSVNPSARPAKSKVDELAKIRDEKVKLIIPESQFPNYLELELAGRPKGPEEGEHRPN
jgi:uncharacterized protein YfkK (UPF0435 family)